jgi:hypothetical protein
MAALLQMIYQTFNDYMRTCAYYKVMTSIDRGKIVLTTKVTSEAVVEQHTSRVLISEGYVVLKITLLTHFAHIILSVSAQARVNQSSSFFVY